jgi:hypothetical protein
MPEAGTRPAVLPVASMNVVLAVIVMSVVPVPSSLRGSPVHWDAVPNQPAVRCQ